MPPIRIVFCVKLNLAMNRDFVQIIDWQIVSGSVAL